MQWAASLSKSLCLIPRLSNTRINHFSTFEWALVLLVRGALCWRSAGQGKGAQASDLGGENSSSLSKQYNTNCLHIDVRLLLMFDLRCLPQSSLEQLLRHRERAYRVYMYIDLGTREMDPTTATLIEQEIESNFVKQWRSHRLIESFPGVLPSCYNCAREWDYAEPNKADVRCSDGCAPVSLDLQFDRPERTPTLPVCHMWPQSPDHSDWIAKRDLDRLWQSALSQSGFGRRYEPYIVMGQWIRLGLLYRPIRVILTTMSRSTNVCAMRDKNRGNLTELLMSNNEIYSLQGPAAWLNTSLSWCR